MVPEEVSLHKRALVATHLASHPLPCPFLGSRAPVAGWGCKTSFRERHETPTSAKGKQTGKPVSSQSPHQAVSPKRPYHTAVCLLPLIPLLVNFLHTTLHLSVPLETASETLCQDAEPSLCVCTHSMLMKSTGGSAAESMHAT